MSKEVKNFGLMCIVVYLGLACAMNFMHFSFLLGEYINKIYAEDNLKGLAIHFVILLANIITVSCFIKKINSEKK